MVIFKETSGLFPIRSTITGRDWTKIEDTTPAPVAPVAPVAQLGPDITEIITSLKSIEQHGEDRKDLDDMKKLTINVIILPADVKLIYEKR